MGARTSKLFTERAQPAPREAAIKGNYSPKAVTALIKQ